jgi:hypothetical protein
VRRHLWIAGVLGLAALLRLAVAVEYRPALLFTDSFFYLDMTGRGEPVGIAPERPSGYPLLVDALWSPGRTLAGIPVVQHLAGLAAGALVYALLVRAGIGRRVAAGAAALVLLDGYAIALEQHVLSETVFALLVVASLFLAARPAAGWADLAASGALLGLAATFRVAALFAVPVWLAYVVLRRRAARPVAAAVAGLLVPLLAYGVWHDGHTGHFGLTQARGWILYSRVGEIGDCRGADVPAEGRALCRRSEADDRGGAAYFLADRRSPAVRAFGGLSADPERQARSDRVLRDYALAIVRDRPLEYAGLVAGDLGRFFQPGARSKGNEDTAVELPEVRPEDARGGFSSRRRTEPSGGLARVLRAYVDAVHTPRWLMGPLLLAALAGGLAGLRRRNGPEALLLGGSALAMLLGAAAVSDFVLRYLIPVVPLIVAGGVLGAAEIVPRRSAHARGP